MKVLILQSIADKILERAKNAKSDERFKQYYDMGMWFDSFCIDYFGVYLN